MSELLVNTIKKADGTGSITVPAETGTVVLKDSSNDVTLNDITAGGIYLGGTGSANFLEDYEEGTWTPTYVPVTGSFTSITYDADNAARYVKIGKMVMINGSLRTDSLNTTGASGLLKVGGLPFASSNGSNFLDYYAVTIARSRNWSSQSPREGAFFNNMDEFYLTYYSSLTGDFSYIEVTDMGTANNNNHIIFTAVYNTDA